MSATFYIGYWYGKHRNYDKNFYKKYIKKIHKFKFFTDLNLFKINNNKSSTISKIKNSKYNSSIIHNNCGTPDCCGQCETAIKN